MQVLHGLLEGVNYKRHEVGIVYFNSKSFPILLGCSHRRCAKIYGAVIYFSSDLQFTRGAWPKGKSRESSSISQCVSVTLLSD